MGLAVGIVCLGVAALIADLVIESGPGGYRTAVATSGGAAHTVDVTGTVAPVSQATADFQVGGTVSAVDVSMGDHVTAGQVIASLSPTSLQEAVTAAETTLSSAQAQLTENENGEATTVSGGSSTKAFSTTAAAAPDQFVLTAAVLTAGRPGGSPSLAQAQQAVVNAQKAADQAVQTAAADLATAESVCSQVTTPTTTTSTTSTTSTSTTSTTIPTTTTTTGSNPGQTCSAALGEALSAQTQLAQDQNAVAQAESQLAQVLTQLASSSHPSTGSTKSGSTPSNTEAGGSSKGQGNSSQNGSNNSGETAAAADSAQQLASDQATIDADQANLVDAQTSLADAKLVSPLTGTVAAVGIAPGQAVSAASSSSAITVIGTGSYEATADLSVDQVPELAIGDSAYLTVDGTTGSLTGTVTGVGPVEVSSSSDVYPLVVAITSDPDGGLPDGSAAEVQVVTSQTQRALVVPTSAVHTSAAGHTYVLTLKSGKTVETRVTVGVVGDTYTQITSGISMGTTVVLADLSQPLPSSNESSTLRGLSGTGGFGGSVFRGAGGGGFAGAAGGGGAK